MKFDTAIIGGGLAGLAASILLARKGFSVAVFEKDSYPAHKVCGEYISLESAPFLQSLGLPLDDWKLPIIKELQLTAPNGRSFTTSLPLGGMGISRYKLDHALRECALAAGATVYENTKVTRVEGKGPYIIETSRGNYETTTACSAFGKKSNLDVKWNRSFLNARDKKLNNYVGIKYHVHTDWPAQRIGLHNFKQGYCGISKIEEDRFCFCYLTHADALKKAGNSIEALEATVLARNPHLAAILRHREVLPPFPLTISQISFASKTAAEDGILMLGDAAGMITPLCGNGMSIALHSAKLAAAATAARLEGSLTSDGMVKTYEAAWSKQFSRRLAAGRLLQRFFGSERLSNVFVGGFARLPFLARPVIRLTHGEPF